MGKDYIYAIAPLVEDALIDRDAVHRQTACAIVKHVSLGCVGLSCEDALLHILNFVWPNIFETSPHVIKNVFEVRARSARVFFPSLSRAFPAVARRCLSRLSPPLVSKPRALTRPPPRSLVLTAALLFSLCVLLFAPILLLLISLFVCASIVRRRSRAAASRSARA